jgi:hypothetical protein
MLGGIAPAADHQLKKLPRVKEVVVGESGGGMVCKAVL